MGASAGIWMPIVAAAASGAIGSIMAPDGQKLSSFEGTPNDPNQMMNQGRAMVNNMLERTLADAEEPITMRTTVNPLPSFHGGALPMAISAPGMDANRLNPDLRTTRGFTSSYTPPDRKPNPDTGPGSGGPAPELPPRDPDGYKGRTYSQSTGPNFGQRTLPGASPYQSTSGQQGQAGQDQTMAALELLLGGKGIQT